MSFVEVPGHYERHPYPLYPLLASIRRYDTYALNLTALWARFNGELLSEGHGTVLLAGCGAFSPYPVSVANPRATITGIDLALHNLRRARLHCLLHGRFNVRLEQGDFLEAAVVPGPYHLIEAFGVLHHLDDPVAGMQSLEQRLLPGGILRVMVYGRYARQEAESIRRAMRLLKVRDVTTIKSMIRRAEPGSRLRSYVEAAWEANNTSGLADLFLHPNVKTYRIDEFMEMVAQAGLKPLLFAHRDALEDPVLEIERLRELDCRRATTTNIICYLGKACSGAAEASATTYLLLNPALRSIASHWMLGAPMPMDRLGHDNPPLTWDVRRFLCRFRRPVLEASLSADDRARVGPYLRRLFLVRYHAREVENSNGR